LAANALKATGNPALGLDFGANIRIPQMGVLGLAIMSSPTVGQALEVSLRHYRTVAPGWELSLEVVGKTAYFRISASIPLGFQRAFSTEALLVGFKVQGEMIAGRPLPIRRVYLGYPEPPYSPRYRDFQDAEYLFGQSATFVEFDAEILLAPVAFADPATAKLAEHYTAQQNSPGVSTDGLVAQVKNVLGSFRERPPDLGKVASALQTSTRSLRRALHDMGTSYQELLDELRRTRAEEWVRTTDLTFEQMAERLGFSNVRSFRRAFKRWTGRTPGEFRDERAS
jgi:AraC-like DNA-binding protein